MTAAEEEDFQESEVIFYDDQDDMYYNFSLITSGTTPDHKNKKKKSVPLRIPDKGFQFQCSRDEFEHQDYNSNEELVPPHVIVERRIARKMAFSVCTGNGRTLKGRDLSQVRNSVLRMTGFLEDN